MRSCRGGRVDWTAGALWSGFQEILLKYRATEYPICPGFFRDFTIETIQWLKARGLCRQHCELWHSKMTTGMQMYDLYHGIDRLPTVNNVHLSKRNHLRP
jgi:hypothetical protein